MPSSRWQAAGGEKGHRGRCCREEQVENRRRTGDKRRLKSSNLTSDGGEASPAEAEERCRAAGAAEGARTRAVAVRRALPSSLGTYVPSCARAAHCGHPHPRPQRARTDAGEGGAAPERKLKYRNKQRVLVLSGRNIIAKHRHLMTDVRTLLPHHKVCHATRALAWAPGLGGRGRVGRDSTLTGSGSDLTNYAARVHPPLPRWSRKR